LASIAGCMTPESCTFQYTGRSRGKFEAIRCECSPQGLGKLSKREKIDVLGLIESARAAKPVAGTG
jgi:hypothetical protein